MQLSGLLVQLLFQALIRSQRAELDQSPASFHMQEVLKLSKCGTKILISSERCVVCMCIVYCTCFLARGDSNGEHTTGVVQPVLAQQWRWWVVTGSCRVQELPTPQPHPQTRHLQGSPLLTGPHQPDAKLEHAAAQLQGCWRCLEHRIMHRSCPLSGLEGDGITSEIKC